MVRLDLGYLPAPSGALFHLDHRPIAPRGVLLHVHAWAEEMNKTRRMVALTAAAAAAAGWRVCLPDLFGCGDSEGDFGDASWAGWCADLRWLIARLRAEQPDQPLVLWGCRAGCLLAAELGAQADAQLWWQPVASGKQALTQFLRLKLAGDSLAGEGGADTRPLRTALAGGESVEIAGYILAPALAAGLEAAELSAAAGSRLGWFELSSREPPELAPASRLRVEQLGNQACDVTARALAGPPFWQTVEIAEAPSLLHTSLDWLGALQAELQPV